MFDYIEKLDFRESANLTIILQSYKYLLQDDDILEKLELTDLQENILLDSIDETIEDLLPKMTENN